MKIESLLDLRVEMQRLTLGELRLRLSPHGHWEAVALFIGEHALASRAFMGLGATIEAALQLAFEQVERFLRREEELRGADLDPCTPPPEDAYDNGPPPDKIS